VHLSKGQLVDVEGRLQTRQWDDDAGKRHWKSDGLVASLEMLSGRSKNDTVTVSLTPPLTPPSMDQCGRRWTKRADSRRH